MNNNDDKKIDIKEEQRHILELFEKVANSPAKEARVARKEIDKIDQRISRKIGKHFFTKSLKEEIFSKYKEAKTPINKAIYLGALGDLVFSIRKERDKIIEIIFQEILDSSGQVRIAAVHLAERASIILRDDRDDRDLLMQRRRDLILRVKKLIEQYAPSYILENPSLESVSVPNLSPSVFKSLLLLWQAFVTYGIYSEQILEQYPETGLDFHVDWFADDNYYEIEPPSAYEMAEMMWKKESRSAGEVYKDLKVLKEDAKKRVKKAFNDAGEKEPKDFYAKAEQKENFEEKVEAVSDFLEKTIERMSAAGMEDGKIYGVIRSFHNYLDSIILYTEEKKPYSLELADAYKNISKAQEKRIFELPRLLHEAHCVLDDFIDKSIIKEKKLRKRIKDSFGDSGADIDEGEKRHLDALLESKSVGHHILEQYFKLLPHDFLKKSSERVAAIALDILYGFNMEDETLRFIPFDRRELTELGGWKSYIGQSSSNAFHTLKYAMNNHHLSLLSPIDESDPFENEFASEEYKNKMNVSKNEGGISASIGTPYYELDPKELEYRLQMMLERYGISDKISIEEIKEKIYGSVENSDKLTEVVGNFHKWFADLFPESNLQNEKSYYEIMGTSVDAWNAFPHANLDSKSPLEMIKQELKNTKQND